MKFSEIVALAKKIAKDDERRYPLAFTIALSRKAPHTRPSQTLRVTRGIVIDYTDLDERLTLLQAGTTVMGREGGAVSAERRRQMKLQGIA